MAAPHVAGALALLAARFPSDSHTQRIRRLLNAVDKLDRLADRCTTGGRLNLHRALATNVSAAFGTRPTNGPAPLTVQFRDDSVGSVSRRIWDFGDGTFATNELAPAHTYPLAGEYAASLIAQDSGGSWSTQSVTITSVANYEIGSVPYAWVDTASLPVAQFENDLVSAAYPLPFPFLFYGHRYEQVFIGGNGLMGFIRAGLETPENHDLPNSAWPNALIGPYWDRIDLASGGAVRLGVMGLAPNRRFVVTWEAVSLYNARELNLTFQVVLEETSQQILFQYQEVHPESGLAGGRRATVGIENETGLVAAKYAVNGSPLLLSNQMTLAFHPTSRHWLEVVPCSPPVPVTIRLWGDALRRYVLESSPDFTLWSPVITNTAGIEGCFDFQDPASSADQQRFYRSRLFP
jgi:hypothetical protein